MPWDVGADGCCEGYHLTPKKSVTGIRFPGLKMGGKSHQVGVAEEHDVQNSTSNDIPLTLDANVFP
jgi:hypothetical protein